MKSLIVILILVVAALAIAQPPDTLWTRTYGGNVDEKAHAIQQTGDGGFIIAGFTNTFGAGGKDFYLIKTDSAGNTEWDSTYGGTDDDMARWVQQTDDGGYIVVGYTISYSGDTSRDVWLIKTNANGDTLWTRTFGGTNDDEGACVQQTADGGYIIAGETHSFGAGDSDFYIVRTDSIGDTLWTRTYGDVYRDEAFSIRQTIGGGYVVAGFLESGGPAPEDLWLIKIDSIGGVLWDTTYGGNGDDKAFCVQQTTDSGFVLVGITRSFGEGLYDWYIVKTDPNGLVEWNTTYGGLDQDHAHCVQQTADGGYIVAGDTRSFGSGEGDFYVVKMDSSGNTCWTQTYGGIADDYAYSVEQTADGGYIVAGYTNSYGAGDADFWLIKVQAEEVTYVCGDVSGTWTAANSPYHVICEISVLAEDTLIVEPGVEVIFQGHYRFIVNGLLQAIGTEEDSILFTAADSVVGWHGIRFLDCHDSCALDYCMLEYGMALGGIEDPNACGGAIFCDNGSSPTITNCAIRNNLAFYKGGGICCFYDSNPIIKNCKIISNLCGFYGGGIELDWEAHATIKNCIIKNNLSGSTGGGICTASHSNPMIENCLFVGNESNLGVVSIKEMPIL